MIYHVFSVRDSAAKAFLPPWIMHQVPMAVRLFGNTVNQPDHQWSANPEDFSLYRLGTWDDGSAQYDLLKEPELVCQGVQMVKEKQ